MTEQSPIHNMVRQQVINLARQHEKTWGRQNIDFWASRIKEESKELVDALDGRHHHSPEREAVQLSATLMNFLAYRYLQFESFWDAACGTLTAGNSDDFEFFIRFCDSLAKKD